jgi:hypothetical protein
MIYNENLLIWILIWILIWFIIWFIVWVITNKKITLKRQEIFWSIFFIVWLWMHLYWFMHKLDVPMIFDIVGAWSAWAILWLEVSEWFTKALLSKIWKWK